jgi:hypothetical protein
MAHRPPKIKTTVHRLQVELEPTIDVFVVLLENKSGSWHHTVGNEHDLRMFLEGVAAGCSLSGGYYSRPEVPMEARDGIPVPRELMID